MTTPSTTTVDTAALKAAVAACAKVADPAHRVLSNIRLSVANTYTDARSVTVTASDLDTTITVDLTDDVDTHGDPTDLLIPASLWSKITSRAPGANTHLAPGEGHLAITSGRWSTRIPCLPADDWPNPGDTLDGPSASTSTDIMLAAIAAVGVAASKQKDRPLLAGVHFTPSDDGLLVVATDSYRLSVRHIDTDVLDHPATIPADALRMVSAHATPDDILEVATSTRAARFTTDRTAITTRLIEGNYPQWERLIPTDHTGIATIPDPDRLAKALDRAGRTFGGEQNLVRLTFTADQVTITATDPTIGGDSTETVDLEWDGPDAFLIGMNATFLSEGLRTFTGPVTFAAIDDLKPTVIRSVEPASDHDLYLQMPIRLP